FGERKGGGPAYRPAPGVRAGERSRGGRSRLLLGRLHGFGLAHLGLRPRAFPPVRIVQAVELPALFFKALDPGAVLRTLARGVVDGDEKLHGNLLSTGLPVRLLTPERGLLIPAGRP